MIMTATDISTATDIGRHLVDLQRGAIGCLVTHEEDEHEKTIDDLNDRIACLKSILDIQLPDLKGTAAPPLRKVM